MPALESFTDVTYEVEDGLAWITVNRPEHNLNEKPTPEFRSRVGA